MRNYKLYLDDIILSIEKIKKHIQGFTFEQFSRDDKTIDAVVRNFEIIGEAAARLPESIKNKYPDIPWKEIIGMRNIVIHEYFGVDIEEVWKTIEKDIVDLENKIRMIIKNT